MLFPIFSYSAKKWTNLLQKFLKVTFNDLNNIHVGDYNIPTRVLFKDF